MPEGINLFQDTLIKSLKFGFVDNIKYQEGGYSPQILVNNSDEKRYVLTDLQEELSKCTAFYFSVAFVTKNGIAMIKSQLSDLMDKKVPGKIWQNLYLRSYLRNGDLFALSLRLIILSLTALIFIEQSWIAVAIVILFNYLLLFQLLALYHAFDYQYLTQLFPVGKGQKEKGLKEILRAIGVFVLILESLIGLLVFKDKILVLALVGASLVLQFLYLPYQLRRLVDE